MSEALPSIRRSEGFDLSPIELILLRCALSNYIEQTRKESKELPDNSTRRGSILRHLAQLQALEKKIREPPPQTAFFGTNLVLRRAG